VLVTAAVDVLGPTAGDFHDEPVEAAFFLAAMDQVAFDQFDRQAIVTVWHRLAAT
jgi:hypothetical protein